MQISMTNNIFEKKNKTKYKNKQEGPEGPGMLTWDRRFLRVPFFIALYTTGDTWEVYIWWLMLDLYTQ